MTADTVGDSSVRPIRKFQSCSSSPRDRVDRPRGRCHRASITTGLSSHRDGNENVAPASVTSSALRPERVHTAFEEPRDPEGERDVVTPPTIDARLGRPETPSAATTARARIIRFIMCSLPSFKLAISVCPATAAGKLRQDPTPRNALLRSSWVLR